MLMRIATLALLCGAALGGDERHDDTYDPRFEFTQHDVVSIEKRMHLRAIHDKFLDSKSLTIDQDIIQQLINNVDNDSIRKFATDLSGESATSPITVTRHSNSIGVPGGIMQAVEYVESALQQYGFATTRDPFRDDMGPNVIGEKLGTTDPDEIVVIGAHLDCRNRNIRDSTGRAPGANDDGSGSTALLEIARVISQANVTFGATIRLGFWSGEEQGLIGSRDYAARLRQQGANVIAMLQADMIAYRADRFPQPTLHLVSRNVDLPLTSLVRDIVSAYVPPSQLTIGSTTACCSDHQSFVENGFPSAGFVEGGGYSIDPQYHNVGDVVNRAGYDITQINLHTRGMLASASVIGKLNG